jgi:hypothetical protein
LLIPRPLELRQRFVVSRLGSLSLVMILRVQHAPLGITDANRENMPDWVVKHFT